MNEKQIREMCDDIYCGESWQPMIDYIINLQNRITELEQINQDHQKLNGELRERINKAIEYFKYQLQYLDFEKDIKARMLCSMGIVLLQGSDDNE